MRTIAVLNQKGGVGKTTTAVNTAAALAAAGSKVVVIDLDPQAHMTIHLGIEPQEIEAGSYKVLTQSAPFEEQIVLVRPNLWLLPANIDLVGAESELVSVVGREIILREALQSSEDKFDYCLIDCAPSLGLLTLNALAAAKEVLIPLQPHFLALQGFGKLLQTIELVNKRINPGLKVKGILLCMFDTRASLPSEVKADIEQFLENARGTDSAWAQARIIPTFIRRNIKLAEAPSYGKTIFEYEPDCNGAKDYWNVARCVHADFQPVPEMEMPLPAADQTPDEADYQEPSAPQAQIVAGDEIGEQPPYREPSPPRTQYVDIDEIQDEPDPVEVAPPQPDGEHFESERSQDEPPIRIEPVGRPDHGTPEEYTAATDEPDKTESAKTDYEFPLPLE